MTADDLIAAAYDPETTAAVCRKLADALREHLQCVQSAGAPVSTWVEPADNIAIADQILEQAAGRGDLESISQRFEQLVRLSLGRGQNLSL